MSRWKRDVLGSSPPLLNGAACREFNEFEYQTVQSWSRSRRVVGKAEVTLEGANPRFVVTNLPKEGFGTAGAFGCAAGV